MKIRVRLLEKCNSKLPFVKILKEYTGLGLKDAKDLMEDIENKINTNEFVEFDIWTNERLSLFKKDLESQDIKMHIIGGKEWTRELRLLSLVGDKEDVLNFINDNSFLLDGDISLKILKLAFNKLSSEDIIEILNLISNEYNFDEV